MRVDVYYVTKPNNHSYRLRVRIKGPWIPRAGESESKYLGCYFDEFPARRLISDFKEFGKYLTQQTCIDYCKNKGHLYAGVQSSTQCFCGNWRQKPSADDLRPETECSYKCSGDGSQICGGDWRSSIYDTELPGGIAWANVKCDPLSSYFSYICGGPFQWLFGLFTPTTKDGNIVSGETNPNYLGCYFDEFPARRLISDFKDFGKYLTQQTCINYCKGKGHPYAGVQSSTQCFCGNWGQRPSPEDSRSKSECNYKCTGDQSQICGGDWRNSVYETGLTGKTSFKYLGCYFDEDPGRRLISAFTDFGNHLTQQICIAYCKDKGHPYASVQSSTQCFCGSYNEKPKSEDSRPEVECNYKCTGDKSQTCGGHWRNSIYETGLPVKTRSKYLGCYFDEDPGRRLVGDFRDFGKYLTQQTCIDFCKDKGYLYAGVQSSTQCFCGDQKPSADDSRPESQCNYKCSGDPSRICGGDWRNAIYETGETTYKYLGCFFDQHPDRRLISDFKDFGKYLTQETCINYCKDKGYSLAGVQSSTQCFCGDKKPVADDSRPETECNYKCNGDRAQICGGDWRNSIYETGLPEPLIFDERYDYVGCFMDQEPRALSGFHADIGEDSSPEKCITLCTQKGYVYAGLQFRSHCFCGDEHPVPAKRADQGDCKFRCLGDKRFICGGDWRNNVYKTGNSDSLASDSRYRYLGCYTDQEPRELRGHYQDIGNQNSPERCVMICKGQGYVYAGLQQITKCFCGDQDPKPEKRTDPKDCKYKCPGDYRFTCGGDWRNSIYKTGHPGASMALEGYEYMGCYRDQVEPRLLRGEMLDFPETLTPSLCVEICQRRGYVYAGLELSSQCFCGDNEVVDSYKVNEEECHMKCTGNRTTICGGSWRLTVYKTGNKASSVAKLDDNEYMGCYKDQIEPRLLQGHSQHFPETLTPQLCVALCKRKGYIYAGLQTSSECFCGDEQLHASAKARDSDCSSKCTGDRSVFCGGPWRVTIYKTGNSGSSVADFGYQYLGCFRDISYPRKLSGFMAEYPETLTPQHCVTLCKQKGFVYAGLQKGFQCYCGNENPSNRDKRHESECNSKCRGDLAAICGGAWRNTIYSTGNSNDNTVENTCLTSVTRVNGKVACFNEVVFEDHFDSLSTEKWSPTVQIPNEPDYQFVVYKSDPANMYTANGKLVIKPTLVPDSEVKTGDLHLENCTGNPDKRECGYKAQSYVILPPVQSAYLTTRNSFNFQYGKVEISAKLPEGDWLVPEIWLEPKNEAYGPGYASGRICIAMSRGNNDLTLYGRDIGCKHLQSGVFMGVGDNIRGRTVTREDSVGWHSSYHNYTVIWTPENILFSIDGRQPYSVVPNGEDTLTHIIGFTSDVTPLWSSASRIAPFDNDFYISFGVSAGGIRNFPDNAANNGRPKPWRNLELKAMLKFWRDKVSWLPTWHDDTALLSIDYIKVTSL